MRPIQTVLTLLLLTLPVHAQSDSRTVAVLGDEGIVDALIETETPLDPSAPQPVGDRVPADFLWENRLVVVFADTPLDPAYTRQIELLGAREGILDERSILVLTDTDPAAQSPMRRTLRPRGFALVIVDKDGRVLFRKPSPWDVREITRAIDKTPLRRQELREMKNAERPTIGLPAE